jgi:PleD family two-component response regulator
MVYSKTNGTVRLRRDPVRVTSGEDVSAWRVFPFLRPSHLRILMLESSEADAEMIKHELGRAGLAPVTKSVDSEEAFISALREFAPEIVLSDHSLAQFDACAALRPENLLGRFS